MIKPLAGSWFEFQHHNAPEGKYWNQACRAFTEDMWREKVREMRDLGMRYIVLLATSLVDEDKAEAYFDTDIYPPASGFNCSDPMRALMSEAQACDMRVFVSAGFYGVWTRPEENMTSAAVRARAFRAMERVYELYGRYDSFYGWYLPDETCARGGFDARFVKYVNQYAAFGRGFDGKLRVLIAPYGTNQIRADDDFVKQLCELDADMIAYQDEVGVRKSRPEQVGAYFEALRRAHDRAGRAELWADVEMFDFEGEVYKSALIPARIERLRAQLEAVSPCADVILGYQYMGMMNARGTQAYSGHPDSVKYREDYASLTRAL